MSLFDKDLVERSIDYSNDPEENMGHQIRRALIRFSRKVSEWHSYMDSMDSVFRVKDDINDFMYALLNGYIPKGFLGPFKEINTYRVTVTPAKIPIIKVVYQLKDINEYKEIQFQFIAGLPPISKI